MAVVRFTGTVRRTGQNGVLDAWSRRRLCTVTTLCFACGAKVGNSFDDHIAGGNAASTGGVPASLDDTRVVSGTGGAMLSTASGGTSGSGGQPSAIGGSGANGGWTGAGVIDDYLLCPAYVNPNPAADPTIPFCTPSDIQLCYRTCGPLGSGFQTVTCQNGSYVYGDCAFPPGVDYACYKIPAVMDPSCPTTPPMGGQPCTVAACVLCNVGGVYLTSAGASKIGYCICNATAPNPRWSCGTSSTWPCPGNLGC